MTDRDKLEQFEMARPRLMGVAYRLLGSMAEAEDAVQDTAARWFAGDASAIAQPAAWLTRVCTNRCLDILRSSRWSRTDYVGPWLPDQIQVAESPDASEQLEIASSLTTAFLLLLERLSPKERAAYLLHDIFGLSFKDIAETLGMSESNSRKHASRARKLVREENVRFVPDPDRQFELLDMFQAAVTSGDLDPLKSALSEDLELRIDSGGKVPAIRRVLSGRGDVGRYLTSALHRLWQPVAFQSVATASGYGLLASVDGVRHAVVTFGLRVDGRIGSIFILRNPEKIDAFLKRRMVLHPGGGVALH